MRVTFAEGLKIALIFLFYSRMTGASVSQCAPIKGQLTSLEGTVEIGYGGKDWQAGKLDSPLCEDDSIRVGANSRAAISLIGDVVLRLDQNTTVRLIDLTEKKEDRSVIELIKGALQSLSRSPRKLAINTPYINGMIEGTEFLTRVEPGRADITVFEGKVIAQNERGSLPLTHGQSAEAKQGQAPQPRIVARPRDAVQWALYYPPVLDLKPDDFPDTPDWQGSVRHSTEAYQNGNLKQAFDLISKVPDTVTDSRFLSYRAALLLSVGRVDKAHNDIDNILRHNPNDGNALALQTIIKVVQNQEKQALDIANIAVSATPDSPAVLMALSYAQQSVFDLEGAKMTVDKIITLDPQNALAWARLSELQASFGELDEAQQAAAKGTELKPDLSRTQTVLGFSHLMQINTRQAKDSFNKAIALAPSDPLPRLGLGLAKIREGDLAEGRRDLEIAAGLDPNNAIVRSYLGKAYYEEKRTALTDREYETAKELDPNDPTPYFYDAIQKQTTNRPVEALHDIQKAIELNDNRAVYRSRLLLDADLAARSASMGRIYSDLGFEQLALREGWKSVNTDPSNFSSHRLLADSYSAQPRHEIARVSELLQSQLLQPLNMTPIQPRLAESNLFLISAGGPGSLSFNEFNPIFNRNGITFQGNSLVGENDTYAGEGIVSGIYKNASFSVGGFHYTSDGFRQNADQQDDIANAFLQYELSPNTSFQGEYRYRETDKGDLLLRFFPENFFTDQRNNEVKHTYRLGFRHNFTPNSIILGSYTYQENELHLRDEQFPIFGVLPGLQFDFQLHDPNRRANGGELQHLFRSRYVNLTSGVGYFDVNGEFQQSLDLTNPLFAPIAFSKENFIIHHLNLYTYAQIKPIKQLTATLGASYDTVSGDYPGENVKQFNPKFGLSWEPIKGTTLRGAIFRGLKRTLITQQTLEPTQVAGFNQFFDDYNQTESWRYGGALDQKFTKNLFGGVEYSRRDLTVPFIEFGDSGATGREADWKEELGRVYLFWTPHDWLSLRAEYQYERLKRDETFPEGATKADTHKFPLGINFFHPSGLGGMLTATYFNQEGEFGNYTTTGDPIRSGRDDFWIIDAAFKYRLPKRYGIVAMGATNLFDRKFNYFDSDLNNASIQPDRMFFARVTLALP